MEFKATEDMLKKFDQSIYHDTKLTKEEENNIAVLCNIEPTSHE